MKRNGYITVNEAAKLKGCSRQAIHYAIEKGRLEAKAETAVLWKVSRKSLDKLVINPNMQRAGKQAGEPRRYCPNCRASITDTDVENDNCCTQCGSKL